ncbi:MAG: 16S rRNA (uracil(1498)-N(3))-methyltransferase [Actinomycetales bacterium]|nr:16S rRNA (uracil(1498)-N(3))-methyltransferase [Actinomycetales bacterium]
MNPAGVGGSHFYIPPEVLTVGSVSLTGPEAHHLRAVRRVRPGQPVALCDHAGRTAAATVQDIGGRPAARPGPGERVLLEVTQLQCHPRAAPELIVAQALLPGDAGTAAVSLLTEVGVDTLVPWQASRSVAEWTGERAQRGCERWRATAHEATKTSGRAWAPTVTEPVTTADLIEMASSVDLAIACDTVAADPLGRLLAGAGAPTSVLLIIGPEGGLSSEERTAFAAAGARVASLGPTVLRSRSAGGVAGAITLAHLRRGGSADTAPNGPNAPSGPNGPNGPNGRLGG